MDAVLVFTTIAIAFIILSALSAAFGVDSRDGFANERRRSGLS